MNTPVLCNKPDINLSEYPEFRNPAIATAALVMACDYLAHISGSDAGLWLDRFSNAAQLMYPETPCSLPLNPKLIWMILTLVDCWKKLQGQAAIVSDDALVSFCQIQIDDLSATLKEWEVSSK
jgi:hypothetical protein